MSVLRSLDELSAHVRAGTPRLAVHGVEGTFAAAVIARVVAEAPAAARPVVVLVADEARAATLADEVAFFLGGDEGRVLGLPAVETSPYAELSPDLRAIMARQATLFRLSQGGGGDVLVASAPALLRRVIPRDAFASLCDLVLPDEELDRARLAALLARAGFARVAVVEDPGTFAVRGGVIDLFPPAHRYPVRIELFGDLVESIRLFDPKTQRTMRTIEELYVHPVRETVMTPGADPRGRILAAADAADHPSAKTRTVLEQIEAGEDFFGIEALTPAFHARLASVADYLPPAAWWFVIDPDGVRRAAEEELAEARARFKARREDHRIAFAPEDHFLTSDELLALPAGATTLVEAAPLEIHDPGDTRPSVRFALESHAPLVRALERARAEKAEELLRPLLAHLAAARAEGWRVALSCTSLGGAERLRGLLGAHDVEVRLRREPGAVGLFDLAPGAPPTVFLGPLREGFRLLADAFDLITEEEIFGARSHHRETGRPAARTATSTATKTSQAFGAGVADFAEVKPGDFLVHAANGIGVYRGLTKLAVAGGPGIDFLHIDYDGGTLYLPVYRLSEVTRYLGADGSAPRLDRLGGITWEKTQRKVSAAVKKLAEDLLQLYAQRRALPGHAFPAADEVFREFEATFPFEETTDQAKAIDDVLADMEAPSPMDRLVCGDVGYGKTEVALRAALKAVLGGKQVAVLAPTTVLVEQHHQTFKERLAGWPVKLAALSRFSPRAEQTEVVRALAEGKLDLVVGTHRLLSADVRFRDLGLLVVDEEQRFGVTHKERLKKLRTQVDVLTLTATPIPRTLHMALMGMREVSIIATPPADRLAIRTFVCRDDDDVIRQGIMKELSRGGQVFFVCHRIGDGKVPRGDRSLAEWAAHIRELCPEARVAVGHGQMDAEALEKVMLGFVDHQLDVLVCTTIIESGLDIPRANTMFVHRADAFGLAQLYQLRGRIGRSRERAFCYLMVPPEGTMTSEAKQRLLVLQRFTELGAGFQIASHDLEIRGAGDLLGAQQSGEIAAVGFEAYTRILEEAVAELRGEAIRRERDPELNVDLPGYIPDDYLPDTGQRLAFYKRLSAASDEEEVQALLAEMADRYGAVPEEALLLGELMVVKAYGRRLGAVSIDLTAERLALALDSAVTPLRPEKVLALVNRPKSPYRLTPDMRLVRTFADAERKDRIRAAKRCLLELVDCAN